MWFCNKHEIGYDKDKYCPRCGPQTAPVEVPLVGPQAKGHPRFGKGIPKFDRGEKYAKVKR